MLVTQNETCWVHRVSAWEGRWYQPFDLRCSIFQALTGRFPSPPPNMQLIPWALSDSYLMVALAGSPTLLACGRLFLLTWLCVWSNVAGSNDTKIHRTNLGAGSGVVLLAWQTPFKFRTAVVPVSRPWDRLTDDARGRRLGWHIAAVVEQISREKLPQRASELRTWMEKVTLLPLDRLFFSTSFLWRKMSPQSRHWDQRLIKDQISSLGSKLWKM